MARIKFNIQAFKNNIVIIIIGTFTLFMGWDGDYNGGDIAASRQSYLGTAPIDIWGSFSGFFYGEIPNRPVPWGMYLYVLQIVLTVFSLINMKKLLSFQNNFFHTLSFYIFAYLALCFATTLTRDATLSVFIIFGISIILLKPKLCKLNLSSHFFAVLIISMGLALRPWLVLVVFLILFFLTDVNSSKKLLFGFVILGVITPFILNYSVSKLANIRNVHPELQVMIMDGGSIACLSSYDKSRDEALKFLNIFNDSNFSATDHCANFRINTWATLGKWQISREELGIDWEPTPNYKITPTITIYSNMSPEKYGEIRQAWVDLIKHNPKDYSRSKFIHFTQLLLLGDTSQLRFKKIFVDSLDHSVESIVSSVFFAPWDLIIFFHLLAPLPTLVLFSFIIILRGRRNTINDILKNRKISFIFTFMGVYLIMTTFAYIGDTGRYMYLPAILFWYFIVPSTQKIIHEK